MVFAQLSETVKIPLKRRYFSLRTVKSFCRNDEYALIPHHSSTKASSKICDCSDIEFFRIIYYDISKVGQILRNMF